MTDPPRTRIPTEGADLSDELIVHQLRLGREDGLAALVRKHGPQVKGTLLRRFGDRTEGVIEDAINDAALAVWERIGEFDPTRLPVRAWFFVLARNRLISRLRLSQLSSLMTLLSSDHLDGMEERERPEAGTCPELLRELAECIERLGPLQKHIILADLAHGGSADSQAIAARWGTTLNSVCVSRHKAHRRLRRCLEKKGCLP